MGCKDCKRDLHVGTRYNIYWKDAGVMGELEAFLFAHVGHNLIFGGDDLMESDGEDFLPYRSMLAEERKDDSFRS